MFVFVHNTSHKPFSRLFCFSAQGSPMNNVLYLHHCIIWVCKHFLYESKVENTRLKNLNLSLPAKTREPHFDNKEQKALCTFCEAYHSSLSARHITTQCTFCEAYHNRRCLSTKFTSHLHKYVISLKLAVHWHAIVLYSK